ncbi:MAG: hypothetical protein QOE90_1512 [Thermoplasmata archaeon]|jgi:hypothetical protein|nr:hypothetical protein [Thermoplasmata archaeon]
MGWNDDGHGKVFKPTEAKLYGPTHTWAMKLSQLHRQVGVCRIVTYSLPALDYAREQFGRRPFGISLVCNEKFLNQAREIKRTFPRIEIRTHPRVHSKILLIEPGTVYVSSANFGRSMSGIKAWHETTLGVRSTAAHDWYVQTSFDPLWKESNDVQP